MDYFKLFVQYGFGGLVSGVLFYMIWKWSVWVMDWINMKDKQSSDERVLWLAQLKLISDSSAKIIDAINDHDRRADERGKYVREEHIKMLDGLTVLSANSKETCDCLKEVKEGLGRVNGYKH